MICPLCNAEEVTQIVSGEAWRIMYCMRCENAWTDPPPSVDYSVLDFHASALSTTQSVIVSLESLPNEWKTSILIQKNLLVAHLPQGARILEIGCGEGLLMAVLIEAGFSVEGIEPSVIASERGRSKGLVIHTGYFPEAMPGGRFDAIVASQVLEHMCNPGEVLSRIRSIVPQGYLLLVQTNFKGFLPRFYKERWYAWVPDQHYWHFTPKGVFRLAKNSGFEFVTCEFSSLVHGGRLPRLVALGARFFPSLFDQFHLLMRSANGKH